MTLTEDQSTKVIRAMIRVMAECDQVLIDVQDGCAEDDFYALKQSVGRVMGEVFLEVLRPIFDAYPHLEPTDPEAWRAAGGLPTKDSAS